MLNTSNCMVLSINDETSRSLRCVLLTPSLKLSPNLSSVDESRFHPIPQRHVVHRRCRRGSRSERFGALPVP